MSLIHSRPYSILTTSTAIVHYHKGILFFDSKTAVQLMEPQLKYAGCHPNPSVGFIFNRKAPRILEASQLLSLSNDLTRQILCSHHGGGKCHSLFLLLLPAV